MRTSTGGRSAAASCSASNSCAHAMHADAAEGLGHGGERADDVVVAAAPHLVQRPGAVLAARPGDQRLASSIGPRGHRRRRGPQRRFGGAVAGFPRAADRAPQRFVRRLAGQEDAAVERLRQRLARRLSAHIGGRDRAHHPWRLVPARGGRALDDGLHVGAVESAEPGEGEVDHRGLALRGQFAAERAADVDHADRAAQHVAEDRRGAAAFGFLEDDFVGPQPQRVAGKLERNMVVAAELEPRSRPRDGASAGRAET